MSDIDAESNETRDTEITVTFFRTFQPISKPMYLTSVWQLACLSIAFNMGLSNFSHFPLSMEQNGRGTFIVPYIIILMILGKSIVYLEMSLGQFSGRSPVGLFRNLFPSSIGIGICQCLICTHHLVEYGYLTAICLGYITNSLDVSESLPWTVCFGENKTECNNNLEKHDNFSLENNAAEVFFYKRFLRAAEKVQDGMGYPDKTLIGYLTITWAIVGIISVAGTRIRIYYSYFCILLSVCISSFMVLTSMSLPGVTKGMMFIIFADWKYILRPGSWTSAFEQCIFSLGVGTGVMTNYASYIKINPNLNTAALCLIIASFLWNTLLSVQIFGALGHMAFRFNLPIEEVAPKTEFDIYNVRYMDAISHFGRDPHMLCFLFSSTMYITGVATMIGYTNCIVMNIVDAIKGWYAAVVIVLCVILGATSTVYATRFGVYLSEMIYQYGVETCQQLVLFCQLILVSYIYGLQDWCWDLEFMTKYQPSLTIRYLWAIVLPIIFISVPIPVFLSKIETFRKDPNLKHFERFGTILIIVTMSPIPLGVMVEVIKSIVSKEYIFTKEYWLPAQVKDAKAYENFLIIKLQNVVTKSKFKQLLYALNLSKLVKLFYLRK